MRTFIRNNTTRLLEHTEATICYDLGIKNTLEDKELEGVLSGIADKETSTIYYDRTGRDSWDILDKKCFFHRKDVAKMSRIFDRIVMKSLGKELTEVDLKIKAKKLKHFEEMSMLERLLEIQNNSCTSFKLNSENKIELIEKTLTLPSEDFNPFSQTLLQKVEEEKDYYNFLEALKSAGYSLDIYDEGMTTSFKGKGIVGILSCNKDTWLHNMCVAHFEEYYNKPSRCCLQFKIPSKESGIRLSLKDLSFLGTKEAEKMYLNGSYEPKYV